MLAIKLMMMKSVNHIRVINQLNINIVMLRLYYINTHKNMCVCLRVLKY